MKYASPVVIFFILLPILGSAQGGTWIWMNGDTAATTAGVFGTQGVPDINNTPPGLYEAPNWIDTSGNFWIYGGIDSSFYGESNLWKYNPVNNTWTWVMGPGAVYAQYPVYGVQGVPSITNTPGCRGYGAASWTDLNGDFWLYGGWGGNEATEDGTYNDLWRYNIATNMWTWMKGDSGFFTDTAQVGTFRQFTDSTTPGWTNENTSTWTGNDGGLWFYEKQIMWRYDISINQWAWMKGPRYYYLGYYNFGTLGVEDSLNTPPYRETYCAWKDANGNFYIWGGGFVSTGFISYGFTQGRTDVWRYGPVTNNWTWIAGDSIADDSGHYVTVCVNSGLRGPANRTENRTPKTFNSQCANLFFGFGGVTYYQLFSFAPLNDLWLFDPVTYNWKWISGTGSITQPSYGNKGVAAPNNYPPVRFGQAMWLDANNVLWMFGGGYPRLNDMWKFVPDTSCVPVSSASGTPLSYSLSKTSICNGDSDLLTITGGSNVQITPASNVNWRDSLTAFLFPDSSTLYVISGYSSCGSPATLSFTLPVISPHVSITSDSNFLCSPDSVQICAIPGFTSYAWNSGDTSACIYTNLSGNYYVTATDSSGCSAVSNHLSVSFYSAPPVSISVNGDTFTVNNAVTQQWYLNGQLIPQATSTVYIAVSPGNYTVTVTDSNGCSETSNIVLYTGIENINDNNVMVSPNPSLNGWQLTVSPQLIGGAMQIFDDNGRLVYKSEVENIHTEIKLKVARGVYLLRINSPEGSITKKLVQL